MAAQWQRLLSQFTPGVRALLVLLSAFFVAALAGKYSRAFDLYDWLALSSPAFWKGRVWQGVTYALLPGGIFDFLMNGLMLAWLGSYLERVWSRKELWVYCLVCTAGAGLAKVVLQPSGPMLMVGSTAMILGLLVAWGRVFGSERILMMCLWEMSIRTAAIFMGVIFLLLGVPGAGAVNSLIMLCGGLSGWLYLTLLWKRIQAQPCRAVNTDRIGRLEL